MKEEVLRGGSCKSKVELLATVGSVTFWEAPMESKERYVGRKKEETVWLPDSFLKS